MNYLGNAGSFLSQTILGFFLYLVLLRFWMQWVRADFRNPISQMVISFSNPFVIPLRTVLPSVGSVDTATVFLACAIALLKTFLIWSFVGLEQNWLSIIGFAASEVIQCSVYIFIASIFVQIIISWVDPYNAHPLIAVARSISEPLLTPIRRLIPAIAGLDLSAVVALILLQLALILVVAPLQNLH